MSAPSGAGVIPGGPFKVNILVPMAGRGSRFANVGFVQPKPLIDVAGKPMISWVLDNVDDESVVEATFIIIILREHEEQYGIASRLKALKPRVEIVYVDAVTEGAACTALLARDLITPDVPLFIVNSDQFVEWNAGDFWRQMYAERDTSDGNILCFHVPMALNDVKWSYAKTDPATGFLTDVQEKKVISENATVGFYYWRRGDDFVTSADAMIKANIRVNGEFYVAPVYNMGVTQKRRYTLAFCPRMWGLGVPEDLTRFLTRYARPVVAARGPGSGSPASDWPLAYPRTSHPMRLIAHRGNLEGPNKAEENKPAYIRFALNAGFDVEIDAWLDDATGQWKLGHDAPEHPIDFEFLLTPGLWVHCKNGAALRVLSADPRIHCFWHDTDDYTLTSRGLPWIYPNKPLLGPRSIAVMFKGDNLPLLREDIYGICCDEVGVLRRALAAMELKRVTPAITAAAEPPASKIQLVIFDLDGVLVDSRDLHYEALNAALEEVAGARFVITRAEHESTYDGLSTNQKLRLLTMSKELPLEHHKKVWTRKQELTEDFVRKQIKPTAHITELIIRLKRAGYPVAVASNCIRSSVRNILEATGLLTYVDAVFSNEDVAHAKPEPDIYIKACRTFGLETSQALVIEDSPRGCEAAVRAGCPLVRVDGTASVRADVILRRIREVDAEPEPITVVVPLAGPCPEVWMDGPESPPSEMPSFLADVRGRSAIEWALGSIASNRVPMRFLFLVKDSHAVTFKLESLLARATGYAPTTVIRLKSDTLGALKTVLEARALLPAASPVLVFDGAHVLDWGAAGCIDDVLCARADGAVTVAASSDPRWSYVRVQGGGHASPAVLEVHEKVAVSNAACTGLYFWRRGADFLAAADATVAGGSRTRGSYFVAPAYNAAIRAGKRIEAVRVEQSWSLRSAAEVAFTADHYCGRRIRDTLEATYSEMAARQGKAVKESGFGCDPVLLGPAPDVRRCLALYAPCTPSNFRATDALAAAMKDLAAVCGGRQVLYRVLGGVEGADPVSVTDGALHFTAMQFVGFDYFNGVVPAGYRETVEATLLRHLPAFHINFTRLIVTTKSVLLAGHPTHDVNWGRARLRAALARAGLPLIEPYVNDIVHMTLVRFASPVTPDEAACIERVARACFNVELGTLSVRGFRLSSASWKMQPAELGDMGGEELLL
jgi:HAD superfamily hydrolase (TIGR01509 family)